MKASRKQSSKWRKATIPGIGLFGFVLIYGLYIQPVSAIDSPPEWLRIFDVICVSTRLNEDIFHRQVASFDSNAEKIQDDDLHAMSPDNIAGYLVTDSSRRDTIALMGLANIDGMESRSCSVSALTAGFDEAVKVIDEHFPMKVLTEFKQGTSSFKIFHGYLAGYSDIMAISVQSDGDVTIVSLYDLHDQ